jgi:molybdopterin-guanine dinucleotide biosynthesis protein MobB
VSAPTEAKSSRAVVVTGPSGSGKTTLIVALVPEFARRGIRVATLKHHAHDDFEFDRAGKDSFRHFEAGAVGSGVVSRTRCGVQLRFDRPPDPLVLAETLFPTADLVLIEGYRDLAVPKIEVRRDGVPDGGRPRAESDSRVIALVTTDGRKPLGVGESCAVFAPEELGAIADLIVSRVLSARPADRSGPR